MMKRWIGVGIVSILICTSVPVFSLIPTRNLHVYLGGIEDDDVTPPATTITLNPATPNGQHDWYITNPQVTLTAIDNESGVFVTKYRIDAGAEMTYNYPFIVSGDGTHTITYWSIDNASNVEPWKYQILKIDTTVPLENLTKEKKFKMIIWTATCWDATSGVNRVEFYLNGVLRYNDTEPPYQWTYYFDSPPITLTGITKKPQIAENNITIPVIIGVIKDNSDNMTMKAVVYDNAGLYSFTSPSYVLGPFYYLVFHRTLVVPNHYTGHLGWFFVHATFLED